VGTVNWLEIKRFKEIVDSSEVADRVNIDLFSDSALGKDEALLEGLRLGTHDATHLTSVIVTVDPRFGIFDLPYLFPDKESIQAFLKGPLGKRISEEMAPNTGIKHLAHLAGEWRHITNDVRPIYEPEDLKGLKIRTPTSPTRLKLFKILGANPTSLPFGEVYTALQQGLVDGQENSISATIAMKFGEQQDYLSLTGHVYMQSSLLWSEKIWQTYPADIQQALQAAANQLAGESWDIQVELEASALEECAELMEINDVNMDAFVKVATPIYEDPEMTDLIGKDFVDEVLVSLGRK